MNFRAGLALGASGRDTIVPVHWKVSLLRVFITGAACSICVFGQHTNEKAKFRDALSVDAPHYRLQFENDRTRVLTLTLDVNETVPMHDDPDTLFICVSESCHLRLAQPDGYVGYFHMQDSGQTRWVRAQTRSEKNVGIEKLEMVVVEFKQGAASAPK